MSERTDKTLARLFMILVGIIARGFALGRKLLSRYPHRRRALSWRCNEEITAKSREISTRFHVGSVQKKQRMVCDLSVIFLSWPCPIVKNFVVITLGHCPRLMIMLSGKCVVCAGN
jgi:hypothetical protein